MRTLRFGLPVVAALSIWLTLVPDAHARGNPLGSRNRGTFLLLELDTGFSESAYAGALPGLKLGASAGVTFRLPRAPLRWYVLGSVAVSNSTARTDRRGITTDVDRQDVDLFLANRLVLPVYRGVRVYGELGLGRRVIRERIDRTGGLDALSSISDQWLLVTAVGLQFRLSRPWSLGVRAELTPLQDDVGLAQSTAGLLYEPNRLSFEAQLGFHF